MSDGFKTVRIPLEVYGFIQRFAINHGLSIPQAITLLYLYYSKTIHNPTNAKKFKKIKKDFIKNDLYHELIQKSKLKANSIS